MIYLHGIYKFGRKRIAYRNDFCLMCDAERVSEHHQTFNVWHLFFVPLVPLGSHKKWHCTACGNDPHQRVESSRGLLYLFVAVLALLSVLFWFAPTAPASPTETALDPGMVWSFRLIPLLIGGAIVAWLQHAKQPTVLAERLATVAPLSMDACLYCRNRLSDGNCIGCALRHLPL